MEESTGRHRSPVHRRGLSVAVGWVWALAYSLVVLAVAGVALVAGAAHAAAHAAVWVW